MIYCKNTPGSFSPAGKEGAYRESRQLPGDTVSRTEEAGGSRREQGKHKSFEGDVQIDEIRDRWAAECRKNDAV